MIEDKSPRGCRRGSDSAQLAADLITAYDSGDVAEGTLVFTPDPHGPAMSKGAQ
jgi:hypothetical protein